MHAVLCWTFEEVLGICSLSDGLTRKPHSDTIGSWQDSIRVLAGILKEAHVAASPCVQMVGFRARYERETKDGA
jgi:hypothetical protein